jgi:hypothetical protein
MKTVMVRYTVRPEHMADNVRDIKRVFEQLTDGKPAGLQYASFQLGDDGSFVHIVSQEKADGRSLLSDVPAFKAFTTALEQRCDERPVVTTLTEVGSYKFFAD